MLHKETENNDIKTTLLVWFYLAAPTPVSTCAWGYNGPQSIPAASLPAAGGGTIGHRSRDGASAYIRFNRYTSGQLQIERERRQSWGEDSDWWGRAEEGEA